MNILAGEERENKFIKHLILINMENLKELQLTELSISEKKSINGGLAPLVVAGVIVVGVTVGYFLPKWNRRKR